MIALADATALSSWDSVESFFKDLSLWQQVVAILIAAGVTGLFAWLFKRKRHRKARHDRIAAQQANPTSSPQVNMSGGRENTVNIHVGPEVNNAHGCVVIGKIDAGANVTINLNAPQHYYGGNLPETSTGNVRDHYKAGRQAMERGDFEEAIRCFDAAAEETSDGRERCALLIQSGNASTHLRHYSIALESFSRALREAKEVGDEEGMGNALGSLANTYRDMPSLSGDRSGANARKAVDLYEQALSLFEEHRFPLNFAMTKDNLGNAYRALPSANQKVRTENILKAIACYNAALEIFRRDQYPVEFAMAQNNLGNAYGALPSETPEEREKNLRQAIDHYSAALEVRKRDKYPVEFALLQNNSGTAYANLPWRTPEEQARNIHEAIQRYNAALEIYNRNQHPIDFARTQNNLGSAYVNLPTKTVEDVRKAIGHFNAALEVRKRDEYPLRFATTQGNLGCAYSVLPAGTAQERAENIRKTIAYCNTALEIIRRDEYPQLFCVFAACLGEALAKIGSPEACQWLKDAYSLRQFLPDQGKAVEALMKKICGDEASSPPSAT